MAFFRINERFSSGFFSAFAKNKGKIRKQILFQPGTTNNSRAYSRIAVVYLLESNSAKKTGLSCRLCIFTVAIRTVSSVRPAVILSVGMALVKLYTFYIQPAFGEIVSGQPHFTISIPNRISPKKMDQA